MATGVARPAGEHGVELLLGPLVVLVLDVAEHAIVPHTLVVRVVAQCLRIVGSSLGIALLTDTAESAQVIDSGDVGIAVQSLRTVGLCPGEVVEVELGHSTEEPGFIEIRLGSDGLVKILHGEDIVLIVECRPSYGDKTVHIILRKRRKN